MIEAQLKVLKSALKIARNQQEAISIQSEINRLEQSMNQGDLRNIKELSQDYE